MKIALFHNLPAGGGKRALFEHARRLRERGHVLDAYVLTTADETYLSLAPLCRDVFVYDAPVVDRLTLRSLLNHRWTQPFWKVAGPARRAFAEEAIEVRQQIRELNVLETIHNRIAADMDARDYDLVYVHHCRFLLSPYLLRRLRTPSVYFCQDTLRYIHEWALIDVPDYDTLPEGRWVRKSHGHLATRAMLWLWHEQEMRNVANTRAADLVLANSWYSREAILRTSGVNARVCYLGVNSEFFCPDPAVPRENTVLSVSSMTVNKQHDFILKAVAAIPEARRPRMQVIGHDPSMGKRGVGPLSEGLKRLAAERGVDLTISNEVTDEAVRDAYRQAGVVAFAPILEPFGLVPLEAMACGAPVVGVSEAGVRESVEDGVTGLLTERDVRAFGAALDRVLTDRALADDLSVAGRAVVLDKWNWNRSVDRLERCFEQVLRPEEADLLPQECSSSVAASVVS